jgi:hypothetical protein
LDLAPDFDEFIGSLIAHEVEFLIIGAYALAFHGSPRFTGDLDVFVQPTVANGRRLLAAVTAFGFPTIGLRPEDVAAGQKVVEMGLEPVQIHVMSAITGVEWDEASASRQHGRLGTHAPPVQHLPGITHPRLHGQSQRGPARQRFAS